MQLFEILDNILEHLPAPKLQHPQFAHTPQVQQTLSACLCVSKQLRHLAAERLFQNLHVQSSIDPHRLDVLLRILDPQPEGMSIRPFIRKFTFSIDSLVPVHYARFIPLFNALALSQITHFEFRISAADATIPMLLNNHAFEDAVIRLIKLPPLRSLDIHGRFFTRDFLLGTHVRDLTISGHGIDLILESNDLYTECPMFNTEIAPPSSNRQLSYPSLQSFKTDLVWPRGFPDSHALDFILRRLSCLSVEINFSHAFIKAEALIKRTFSTLTTLIITYNFDGYETELPTTWSINFGQLQALETLEFNWTNSPSSLHQTSIRRGCRPLAGLHSLLDSIQTPMHNLATLRWNFCYLSASLPPDALSHWLQGDDDVQSRSRSWRKLDELLASSGLFPRLRCVSLGLCPVVVPHDDEQGAAGLNTMVSISVNDIGIVESVLSENRQRVFPGLTASLGENFMLKVTSGSVET